jgi:transcriptional regulator with XRE-family HTH domain
MKYNKSKPLDVDVGSIPDFNPVILARNIAVIYEVYEYNQNGNVNSFAEILGMPQNNVAGWINTKSPKIPRPPILVKLSYFFKISLDTLMKEQLTINYKLVEGNKYVAEIRSESSPPILERVESGKLAA